MSNYLIDYSGWFDEGGYCQVYPIKDHKGLIFKEFRNKKKALESYKFQSSLAKHDLAPKIHSKVCQLNFAEDDGWQPDYISDWGYITEYAFVSDKVSLQDIQSLVDDIYDKTSLKFWDCHYYNVGLVSRNNIKKLVCIDTGKESFEGFSNAWGFEFPGPKCNFCFNYQCKCSED